MKNLLISFCFLLFANCVFGQYPSPPQNLGSPSTLTRDSGGLKASQTFVPPRFSDTATANNGFTNKYPGSTIFTSDDTYWVRSDDLSHWINLGLGGGNFTDTVFVRFPLGVDTTTYPGHQIIFIRSPNGLVSGGVVTKSSCWGLTTTPSIFNLNYVQFTSLLTTVTIDTANATMPRIDYVIVDTFDVVSVLTGTPSATPLPPYVNPSSQLILTRIDVPAGASCLDDISVTTVYDQNLGVPTEFATSSSGTITVDFNNTDNPKHLTKAAFVSTYTDGSKLIFTHTALQDTVALNEVFLFWLYLNGNFTNQLQAQFWMNDTAVSNNVVLNPFFNPLDSNEYQNVTLPLSSFVFSSPYFNKLVITHAGDDTSGAKGYYIDWIQLQKGINNSSNSKVDSVTNVDGNLYYWINGIATFISSAGSGSSVTLKTNGVDNGSQSILNLKQGSNVTIADDGVGGVTISSSAPGTGTVTSVGLTSTDITVGGTASPITTSGTYTLSIVRTADQSITSTAGQTAFVFTGVPSSYNAFWLDVNGTTVNQPLYYTKSSNTITLSSGLDNNDTVTLHFK